MTRTEKLVCVLIVLTVSFLCYLFYINFDEIMKDFSVVIDLFKENEIVIPSDQTKYNRDYDYKTVKRTDNFYPNNIDDIKNIYYTVLNNGWNEFTFYCPKEYVDCAKDVKTIADDSDFISLINNYVNPFNSYKKYNTLITNDKEVYLSIDKLYSKDKMDYVNNKIDSIFKELGIDTNESLSIDKIKSIHNYLLKNITYDDEYKDGDGLTSSSTAYGALYNGIALCSGYTDTFAIILDRFNIPNFKLSNKDHVWNVMYYDNSWKHIDLTWDDDEINENNYYNFFMLETNELANKDKVKHKFNTDYYLELK